MDEGHVVCEEHNSSFQEWVWKRIQTGQNGEQFCFDPRPGGRPFSVERCIQAVPKQASYPAPELSATRDRESGGYHINGNINTLPLNSFRKTAHARSSLAALLSEMGWWGRKVPRVGFVRRRRKARLTLPPDCSITELAEKALCIADRVV